MNLTPHMIHSQPAYIVLYHPLAGKASMTRIFAVTFCILGENSMYVEFCIVRGERKTARAVDIPPYLM